MIKNTIFVGFALVFLAASRCGGEPDIEDEDGEDPYLYNEVDFHESVEIEPHFIMFFAPWCGHCKALKPSWSELAEFYNDENPEIITIAKVDCSTDTKLCSDHGVVGYPTLKLYQPGKEAVRYKGARDVDSLKEFISSTLGLAGAETEKDVAVEIIDGLHELTTDTFDGHIATGMHFVKFYAPWCGHCKRMEPAWKELASKLKDNNDVKIGRVDCTQDQKICGSNGVRGYPTLIWFKDGREVEKYQGGRQLVDFLNYVDKMTGDVDQPTLSEEEEREIVQEERPDPEVEIEEGLFELTADNFAKVTSGGDFFIKFFAPWCGHCKRMEPAWKELAKFFKDHKQVKIGRVDCVKHSSVCQSNGVRGYPTLRYFRNGQEVEGRPRSRDFDDLKDFVTSKLAVEEELEQDEEQDHEEQMKDEETEPTGAMELDDTVFHGVVDTGITFVKFYAPWCGHCKRLAPTWDELAKEDFSDLGKTVRIVKLDCTKYNSICQDYEVRGYPTLKLFINGAEKAKYSGARTLEALKTFVLENAADDEEEKPEMRDEL